MLKEFLELFLGKIYDIIKDKIDGRYIFIFYYVINKFKLRLINI